MKLAKWLLMVGALATTPVLALAAPAPKVTDSDGQGVHLSRMTLGYSYFNKPGASVEDHNADVLACLSLAVRTRSSDEVFDAKVNMGLVGDLLSLVYYRGTVGAGLENCMVVRGWRVVRLPNAQGQALAKLPQVALMERLAPWVGADAPPGAFVRAWSNDAANATIPRFSMRPAHQNDGLLSLKAANGQTLDKAYGPDVPTPEWIKLDKTWPRKPVTPAGIAKVTPQAGIVLIRVSNGSIKNGTGVSFTRVGPSPETPASSLDRRPDLVSFRASGDFVAMPVAPGRWRMSSLGFAPVLSFCLGSPAFEIKPGQIVYLGSFDLGATAMGPDLDLAPVRAFLTGQPAAETVGPAAYVNGSTSTCTDQGMYAFEVSGAPFEAGYRFGSASLATARPLGASPLTTTATAATYAPDPRQASRPPARPAAEPRPSTSQAKVRSVVAVSEGLVGSTPHNTEAAPALNRVDGLGVLTREGQTRSCAGGQAWIIRATENADAFLRQAFGPSRSGLVLTTQWEGLPFAGVPQVTTCDADGRFQFSGLSDGAYYIAVVVSWTFPSQLGAYLEQRGGTIVAPVTLSGGVKSIVIAN